MRGTNTYNQGFPLRLNNTKKNKRFEDKTLPFLSLIGLAGFLLLPPSFAQAQSEPKTVIEPTVQHEISKSVRKEPDKSFLSVSYENDLVGDGEDKYYTSGVRLTYFNPNASVPPVIDKVIEPLVFP